MEGERSTNILCNIEKRNYLEKMIAKLIDHSQEFTNIELQCVFKNLFYENFYTSQDGDMRKQHVGNFF